jgi:putative membrane protein
VLLKEANVVLAAAIQDHPWRWQPHPEVWLLVAVVIGLGFYVTRVIEPTMVAAGNPPISARQKRFFWAGVLLLWFASDWPMHDIGENYLFSVHMVQHMLLSYAMPPLFLFAIPEWLARLVIGQGRFGRAVSRMSKPLLAGLLFNLFIALSHWSGVMNIAVVDGPLHYSLHLVLVVLSLMMWMPVCGPLPELRMQPLLQCVYLFLMSIMPTIPAAWLTFADGAVYDVYNRPYRMWGISVAQDQQAAGLIMKLAGGGFLWVLITIIFFKWATSHEMMAKSYATRVHSDDGGLTWHEITSDDGGLTWHEVREELERLGPAPQEPTVGPPTG